MLASRQFDTIEQSHWSFSKFETPLNKAPTTPPRMSDDQYETTLPTPPEWQGQQYAYLSSPENNTFSQAYCAGDESSEFTQPRTAASARTQAHIQGKQEHNAAFRLMKQPTPEDEPEDRLREQQQQQQQQQQQRQASQPLEKAAKMMATPEQEAETVAARMDNDEANTSKESDDDALEDEDMLDGGDGTPQTAAERTAARRKMKRFRLTHQQTRFLMSEFAKQPHPDAAHRERLSREIPGLSPRQVQVWFQNRRAKIKRLTADDRDRMIKMRAVPDDFDNIQALHSPYGAVHGLSTPLSSPMNFGTQSYADHMIRPLMVDVRRPEGEDEQMSNSGMSPGFPGIGFASAGNMNTPEVLSPMTPSSTGDNRYGYGSHLTPMGPGPRTSNSFARQGAVETSMSMHRGQPSRPLQPLQLRETMSLSRQDIQSPLRSSMSWKGDAIDYNTYNHGPGASPPLSGRQQSLYQPEQVNGPSSSGLPYESSSYSGTSSPPGMNYSSFSQGPLSRLRSRASSATLGLDLRSPYRPIGSGQSAGHSSAPRSTSTQFATTTAYTSSFPSAPLTAPLDFSLPRTPGNRSGGVHDYSMPQMSAPIAPPHDFSQAFHASMNSSNARTPMRDTFGGGGPMPTHHENQQTHSSDYQLRRQRSYSGGAPAGSGPAPVPQVYGSSA
ncbi:homeobox domain-containing protein [Colletotrichum graminicola]|uniref:Homeobox domain-containing protein n=1 Tax=Colletotrichum graminicola (strain M1.001 / M2 / FGSC 10212) TaxID=645133 RepID=E3QAU2_COLGM|nr:homeobox domain-containing protein [Colletotrichum graminicola M1.001]EFQ27980.1 homeobox domain-containing protein [Colletotrichum graminicola M1.001]WDK12083.1 homeobox domain-containing protein [Colletotrichum graminicola]